MYGVVTTISQILQGACGTRVLWSSEVLQRRRCDSALVVPTRDRPWSFSMWLVVSNHVTFRRCTTLVFVHSYWTHSYVLCSVLLPVVLALRCGVVRNNNTFELKSNTYNPRFDSETTASAEQSLSHSTCHVEYRETGPEEGHWRRVGLYVQRRHLKPRIPSGHHLSRRERPSRATTTHRTGAEGCQK